MLTPSFDRLYGRLQLSILAVLASFSGAAYGSQLPWENSPIYLRENPTAPASTLESDSFMSHVFTTLDVQPEAETQNTLADILPGFVMTTNAGEWTATPSYFGIGGIPPSPVLMDPYASMDLSKPWFNSADPMFLPSTYFDNDPALRKAEQPEAQVVGIAI